jgi:hypothetical protein
MGIMTPYSMRTAAPADYPHAYLSTRGKSSTIPAALPYLVGIAATTSDRLDDEIRRRHPTGVSLPNPTYYVRYDSPTRLVALYDLADSALPTPGRLLVGQQVQEPPPNMATVHVASEITFKPVPGFNYYHRVWKNSAPNDVYHVVLASS